MPASKMVGQRLVPLFDEMAFSQLGDGITPAIWRGGFSGDNSTSGTTIPVRPPAATRSLFRAQRLVASGGVSPLVVAYLHNCCRRAWERIVKPTTGG